MPQPNLNIHEIHNELEEENTPSTFPVNIITSMTSSITTTQLSGIIFYSSFPQLYFPGINLSQILSATTSTPSVLIEVSGSISPSISPILSTSPELHTTPTSPHSVFPQLGTPISTISYLETLASILTPISSSLAPLIPTPPIIISPISVEIPNPQTSQHEPLVTVQEGTISTIEDMVDFGEDAVVSLGKYLFGIRWC